MDGVSQLTVTGLSMCISFMTYIAVDGKVVPQVTSSLPPLTYTRQVAFMIEKSEIDGIIRWGGVFDLDGNFMMPLDNCQTYASGIEDDDLRMYTLAKLRRIKELTNN